MNIEEIAKAGRSAYWGADHTDDSWYEQLACIQQEWIECARMVLTGKHLMIYTRPVPWEWEPNRIDAFVQKVADMQTEAQCDLLQRALAKGIELQHQLDEMTRKFEQVDKMRQEVLILLQEAMKERFEMINERYCGAV